MRVALLQLNSSDDPGENLFTVLDYVERAAPFADLILTPEVTNCVSASRTRQSEVLRTEHQDEMLSALQDAAAQRGLWISIGSLAVKTADPAGRFANRSVLIGADGAIHGRYDKI
ncbi:MAG: nitrilase-related carbon-nitrogen hydrolase, partial [Pseudomonadota bacterium]